ncbi:MAG: YajQ family cyclic di-GMP-binding protein [Candidatus Firestonebacteria bacterium]|nr:YajQ family cyclic di-GMP-binding protein [Candidatus Firestonebacteria bacterium]
MASDFSFDIVSKINMQEVLNAINYATKEIAQRFDFKGSKTEIKLEEENIHITTDDEYKLKNVIDILENKLVKRSVPIKGLQFGKVESSLGGTVKQTITLQQGIPKEKAKDIIKLIKDTKLKVQTQIQDDQIRVSGRNKDDLQEVIKIIQNKNFDFNMQFVNYR